MFPISVIDAFTDRPFAGNPAAVCLLESPAPEAWMQDLAAEMNLAETAFISPVEEGFALRWFTPRVEVDLCGHATLASAHALWETGRLSQEQAARFQTRSGVLTAARRGAHIELDFPAEPPEPAEVPSEIRQALGVELRYTGRNRMDYLVEVADAATLRSLKPDFRLLAQVEARGLIVTCRADTDEFDFLSRFFAPAAGIDEDPVTGSAHCCLGPYWRERLGRDEMRAFQASRRGGKVGVRIVGSRVKLTGQAVTVLRGEVALPTEQQNGG